MKKIFLISMILVETAMLFSQEVQLQSYISKWKVDRYFTITDDSAYMHFTDLTKREASAYDKVIVEYDKEGVVLDGERFIKAEKVEEMFLTDEKLRAATKDVVYSGYTFKDLGITSKIIKAIYVEHLNGREERPLFGDTCYQINDNEIIIAYLGWFYHAVRISRAGNNPVKYTDPEACTSLYSFRYPVALLTGCQGRQ